MRDGAHPLLGRISGEVAALVRGAAPALAALRLDGDRHASALVWAPCLLVTAAEARAGREGTAVLPGGRVVPLERAFADPLGVAAFRVLAPHAPPSLRRADMVPAVGSLVLGLDVAADASPTARLLMVRSTEPMLLDGPPDGTGGGPVLDMTGALLGLARPMPGAAWVLLAHDTIARAVAARRGWLGAALQPTAVPVLLRVAAGQESARLVVRLDPGGPADIAGLRAGDILLALDGIRMSGTGALRRFLASGRVGRAVPVRLVRDGRMATSTLVLGVAPETG